MKKVLKFWMTGCGPCVALGRLMEKSSDPLIQAREDVDVDEHPELVAKYGIRAVPVTLLVDEFGTVLKRHNGMMTHAQLTAFTAE